MPALQGGRCGTKLSSSCAAAVCTPCAGPKPRPRPLPITTYSLVDQDIHALASARVSQLLHRLRSSGRGRGRMGWGGRAERNGRQQGGEPARELQRRAQPHSPRCRQSLHAGTARDQGWAIRVRRGEVIGGLRPRRGGGTPTGPQASHPRAECPQTRRRTTWPSLRTGLGGRRSNRGCVSWARCSTRLISVQRSRAGGSRRAQHPPAPPLRCRHGGHARLQPLACPWDHAAGLPPGVQGLAA